MIDRREFLKTTAVAASAAVAVASGTNVFASETAAFHAGIVYTEQQQGQWKGKAGSHAPKVTVADGKISVVTEHPMTEPHFIVRHTVVLVDGKVIGSKTFSHTDKPESSFDLPAGYKGKVCTTSFCNRHDLWVTEFTV
ncbi:MAG: twin-arginine translocation signal domain-containing protein [Candidatus Electrothrix sp. GM3_4]|nr:twin-arginine translocation signal domain-containing protein [Candidatus Electrothrix sp. GM3_4]